MIRQLNQADPLKVARTVQLLVRSRVNSNREY